MHRSVKAVGAVIVEKQIVGTDDRFLLREQRTNLPCELRFRRLPSISSSVSRIIS